VYRKKELASRAGSAFAGHVVAIDACVQRRPPAAKLEHEDEAVDRLAQLVSAVGCARTNLQSPSLRSVFCTDALCDSSDSWWALACTACVGTFTQLGQQV